MNHGLEEFMKICDRIQKTNEAIDKDLKEIETHRYVMEVRAELSRRQAGDWEK